MLGACSQGCGLGCVGRREGKEKRECMWVRVGVPPPVPSLLVTSGFSFFFFTVVFLNTNLNILLPCPENPTLAFILCSLFGLPVLTLHLASSHWSCSVVQEAAAQSPSSPRTLLLQAFAPLLAEGCLKALILYCHRQPSL